MHVAVVGGGIVGLASAHYLADRGADVTVLERGTVGAGNSTRTGGGVRAQFGSRVSVRLSQASIEVWERFEETFGVDPDYRRPGYLFLAREESTAEALRANVDLQNDLGVESEFLDPGAAREHCPELNAARYVGATYCPTDGYLNHHRAVQGFRRGALDAGAEIRTGTPVESLCREGGTWQVETPDGVVEADYAVNAAGAWAGRVAAMAGVDLPISPRRRALGIVEPPEPVPGDVAWTADLDDGAHFRPDGGGRALVGGYFHAHDPEIDPDDYECGFEWGWIDEALRRTNAVAGYVAPDAAVCEEWAGLYAMTPDAHPVIGETLPGFVNAVGFSGHGLMQAPATGRTVAELILDGEASIDVSELAANRFEEGSTLDEGTVF